MHATRFRLAAATGMLVAFFAFAATVEAQRSRSSVGRDRTRSAPNRDELKTSVSVELLVGKQGVGLQAQRWHRIFRKFDVPLRIRRSLLKKEPKVSERTFGTTRNVKVVGRLDPAGRIVLPDRVFAFKDADKLREYLRELETYGAQGAPGGKPLWGLSKRQFGRVYETLNSELSAEVKGRPLKTALEQMAISDDLPVRFSTEAGRHLENAFDTPPAVRPSLKGFSKGTALAVLLNQYGLGFHPRRTADGALELVVEPLASEKQFWPVGWDLKQNRVKTAPELFELVPVELQDIRLLDVLDAISARTEVPILVDKLRIESAGIDLERLRVSYPSKRTSWYRLLRGITIPHMLKPRLRIDEQGRFFVWVTTLKPRSGKPENSAGAER